MKIHIVAATDKGYEQHTAVMLASLFANNKSNQFIVHLLHSDQSAGIGKLTKFINRKKHGCELYEIKEASLSGFKISHHISLATYFRLLIPELIPATIGKILYLDSDMVVLSNIDELWCTDFEGHAAAGVKDHFDRYEQLGISYGYEYFNAGVMVWNLASLRKINFTANAIKYLDEKYDDILYWDQDVINYLLQGKVKGIDKIWNVFPADDFQKKELVKIFHYAGSVKPWNYPQHNGFDKYYFRYLFKTPWFLKCLINRSYLFFLFSKLISNKQVL